MSTTAITFNQLKEIMAQRADQHGRPSRASLRNLLSALEQFCQERGCSKEEPIGSVLRLSYYQWRNSHLRELESQGRPKPYIANRKNLLSHWRNLVLELDRESPRTQETDLQRALKELAAGGVSIRRLALEAGVPHATLKRWLTGTRPQRSSVPNLRKIERYLGITHGTLVDLVAFEPKAESVTTVQDNAYRKLLSKLSADPYLLKPPRAIDRFRAEWTDLVKFKVASAEIVLEAEDDSDDTRRWRTRPESDAPKHARCWTALVDGEYCPTADINFAYLARYMGWLELEAGRGGLELAPEQAQTLAQLCNKDNLQAFVNWLIKRAEGKINAGHSMILQFASTLCHPQYGFLTRRPDIGQRIGIPDPTVWTQRCADVRKSVDNARRKMRKKQKRSRDPFEPIGTSIVLENPIMAITDAIKRKTGDRPSTGGVNEAIWARDRLLLALAASNPLRAINLKGLTYCEDNSGFLRRDPDGGWRIVIPREEFKNINGAAKDRDYDMPVQKSVWRYIEQYLKSYRPLLEKAGTDIVFLSSRTGDQKWDSMNRRYYDQVKKYVHRCPGVGPHSIRHLVATAILKKSGSVIAAALVLHDTEATVRKHYGKLITGDGAKWLDEYVGDAFRQL